MPSLASLLLLALIPFAAADTGFGLRAYSTRTQDLKGWPVQNAHITAGINYLTVERPSANAPDHAFLNGTEKMQQNHKARLAFREFSLSLVPFLSMSTF